jgi:hypothetical protein
MPHLQEDELTDQDPELRAIQWLVQLEGKGALP